MVLYPKQSIYFVICHFQILGGILTYCNAFDPFWGVVDLNNSYKYQNQSSFISAANGEICVSQ